MNTYSDAQLALFVAGAVSAIRQFFPQLDGKGRVWMAAFGVAVLLCILPAGVSWQSILPGIQRAVIVAAQAIAGTSLLGYAAGKVGPSEPQ